MLSLSSPVDCFHFIDNQEISFVKNVEIHPIDSPYFGEVIGHYQNADSEILEKAVHAATRAQREWGKLPLKERTRPLFRFREILGERLDEISQMISLESGKTPAEARQGLEKGIEVLEFALSLQNLDAGGKMEVSRGVFCEYRRLPLGIVANLTPFNFPAMVPMWTIPIALVLGNAYLWKPSEKTPLTSLLIADCFKKAGLPSGLFQVLQGGSETAELIINHPAVKAIGFVGSTAVAKSVYVKASSQGKRALCLGGAKNHIVLLPDAHPEISGSGISDSFTGCAGQRCMAASVLLAVGDCQSHISKIVERAKTQVLGKTMGAIITAAQRDFLFSSIERAKAEGAKILLDGRESLSAVPEAYKNGYWLGPTILDHVSPDSFAAKDELFGPILSIVRVNSIAEAMEIENKNPYGNACSVFTSSGALAEKVLGQASAGMLGVNIGVPVPREPFSFAGVNASKFGHGEITGIHSLNFWSDMQKVTTKWEKQIDHNWMS